MSELLDTSEVLRNLAIVVGGALGIWIAWWRGLAANRQARAAGEQALIARRAHITELFQTAVAQLGVKRLEVRLGAIFTLQRIEKDFPDFGSNVFELLSAYVRERSPEHETDTAPVDIQEIMKYLRQRLTEDGDGDRSGS